MSPPKKYVEALTPNMTVFEDRAFKRYWWGWCPYEQKKHQISFSICTGRKSHIRTQRADSCLQARKRPLTRNWICQHLYLGLPALQNCEKINAHCWNHPVGSTLSARADWYREEECRGTWLAPFWTQVSTLLASCHLFPNTLEGTRKRQKWL